MTKIRDFEYLWDKILPMNNQFFFANTVYNPRSPSFIDFYLILVKKIKAALTKRPNCRLIMACNNS